MEPESLKQLVKAISDRKGPLSLDALRGQAIVLSDGGSLHFENVVTPDSEDQDIVAGVIRRNLMDGGLGDGIVYELNYRYTHVQGPKHEVSVRRIIDSSAWVNVRGSDMLEAHLKAWIEAYDKAYLEYKKESKTKRTRYDAHVEWANGTRAMVNQALLVKSTSCGLYLAGSDFEVYLSPHHYRRVKITESE